MFTVEDMVQHTTKTFNTKKEAYQYKLSMESRFPTIPFTLYPAEPIQPFPGMCERCGQHPAEPNDFICMECISLMLMDMENDDL